MNRHLDLAIAVLLCGGAMLALPALGVSYLIGAVWPVFIPAGMVAVGIHLMGFVFLWEAWRDWK